MEHYLPVCSCIVTSLRSIHHFSLLIFCSLCCLCLISGFFTYSVVYFATVLRLVNLSPERPAYQSRPSLVTPPSVHYSTNSERRIIFLFHSRRQPQKRESVLHTKRKSMADTSSAPKPSSSVKLVLLGEAAVGKVGCASPLSFPLLSLRGFR